MAREKITPAGMKLLHRLAVDPFTPSSEDELLASAIQNLINARVIIGEAIEGGWRWRIIDAGSALLKGVTTDEIR